MRPVPPPSMAERVRALDQKAAADCEAAHARAPAADSCSRAASAFTFAAAITALSAFTFPAGTHESA